MTSNKKIYKLIIAYYSTDKNYKALGLLLSSDSVRWEKSYKDKKIMGSIICAIG
jgi:hypothetical protein